jgi:methyl-accepting chemotaxis protein
MNSIKKVSGIVGEIASASKEQAAGIEQVNMALTKMDESTQQNAALVEQAAATAKGMEHQSQQLITEVSYFRTEASSAAMDPPGVACRPMSVIDDERNIVVSRAA